MKLSFKSIMPFAVLVVLALAAMFVKPEADYVPAPQKLSTALLILPGFWFQRHLSF